MSKLTLYPEIEVSMGFERADSAFSCKFSSEPAQPSFLSSSFQHWLANSEPTAK